MEIKFLIRKLYNLEEKVKRIKEERVWEKLKYINQIILFEDKIMRRKSN